MRRRAYYSRGQHWIAVGSALVFGAIWIGLVADSVAYGALDGISVFTAVSFGIPTVLLARCAFSAVYPRLDGVTIVNPLRTHRVAWARIDRFDVSWDGAFAPVGQVVLVDNSTIRIFGIRAPYTLARKRPEQAQEPIQELNQLLVERRRRPVPTDRRAGAVRIESRPDRS